MFLHTCAEAIHIWLVYIIYHVYIYCYTGVPGPQPSGLVWFGIIVNSVPPNYCITIQNFPVNLVPPYIIHYWIL